MRFFKWLLECCYCMIIPEDEYKRENTNDTVVPTDFIPINEIQIISLFNLPATHRFILYL